MAGQSQQSSANFNPRSPRGERPSFSSTRLMGLNFNPRSPRGERHSQPDSLSLYCRISIHAPHEGSDRISTPSWTSWSNFNPRSREGSDSQPALQTMQQVQFQSTLPARGATQTEALPSGSWIISIHAPREGSDFYCVLSASCGLISIHTPREGSDPIHCAVQSDVWNFNPRSPRGERPLFPEEQAVAVVFQSTLPARGATTLSIGPFTMPTMISIHAPREGSDAARSRRPARPINFNPRSPRGERQAPQGL